MVKTQFLKTLSILLVFLLTSPLVALLTVFLVFSGPPVMASTPKELVVVTENLETIPAVLYHFKSRLKEREKIALKLKLEAITGVVQAVASDNSVGVSRESSFPREQIEAKVLKILSSHFKATSVRVLARKQ
jgi:hypothetical protein